MARGRGERREHIRAAKDWLGEAENSLARDNDVQGDLKVMLAKAELAQAGDSPRSRQLKGWGSRVLPLLVAVALVGGVMLAHKPPAAEQPAGSAAVVNMDRQPAAGTRADDEPPASSPAAAVSPAAETQPAAVSQAPAEQPAPAPAPAAQPEPPQTMAAPAPAAPQPAVPAESTQKLMQSAGKILRQ